MQKIQHVFSKCTRRLLQQGYHLTKILYRDEAFGRIYESINNAALHLLQPHLIIYKVPYLCLTCDHTCAVKHMTHTLKSWCYCRTC